MHSSGNETNKPLEPIEERIDSCGIMSCDGAVAQWIEHRFPKPCVGGSSPLSPTNPHKARSRSQKDPFGFRHASFPIQIS
jgi:hypothetical protein